MTTPKKPKKETKAQERSRRLGEALVLLRQGMNPILDLYAELEELRANLEEHFSATDRFEAIAAALETLEPVTAIDPDELEGVSFEW